MFTIAGREVSMHYSDKLGRIIVFLFILSFCNLFFHSCNYFTEPEPFVNKDVKAPEILPYPSLYSQIGDTVKDVINVEFFPTGDLSQILKVQFIVDWDIVATLNKPPFQFSTDTKQWPNGKHIIRFGIYYNQAMKLGVLNLLNMPPVFYCDTIEFLHAPHAPVNILIDQINSHPRISWSHPAQADVQYYVVRRYNVSGQITFQDTISQSSPHVEIDMQDTAIIGKTVQYDVGAANKYGINFSNIIVHEYGVQLSVSFNGQGLRCVVDETDTTVIITDVNSNMWKFSCQTANIIQRTSGLNPYMAPAVNLDRSRIYFLGDFISDISYDFYTVYAHYYWLPPSGAVGLTVGLQDRLYIIDKNGKLFVYDGNTTNLISTTPLLTQGSPLIKTSPDGKMLLTVDQTVLKTFSISGDSFTPISQTDIGGTILDWRMLWTSNEVLINRTQSSLSTSGYSLEIWNYTTFTKRIIPNPQESSEITAITATARYIYAAYNIKVEGEPYTMLVEYDMTTQNRNHQWIIIGTANFLAASQKGRCLFANFSSHGNNRIWILDLTGGTSL